MLKGSSIQGYANSIQAKVIGIFVFVFVEIGSHLNLEETEIYRHLTYLVCIPILDKYSLFCLSGNN